MNITNLSDAAGTYTLWADEDGYLESQHNTTTVSPNATSVMTLSLVGGKILGTVTSQMGPIPDATVSIALMYSTAVSPVDGNYSLQGIPGGTHTVTASAPGYTSVTKDVLLGVGATYFPLNFELRTLNGSIAGYVFRAATVFPTTPVPLNNSNVSVSFQDRTITVTSNPDGGYIIPDLPEGTYTVTAAKEGYVTNSETDVHVVRGDRTYNVNITLTEKPTMIHGTVRSGALLLPGVNISLEGTTWYNLSASDGDYELANLTAGTYNITAVLTGYETLRMEGVVISVGEQLEIDFALEALPGGILRGQVLGSDTGRPLSGVLVTIRNSGTAMRTTTTNVEGRFEFAALSGGEYRVQFEIHEYKPLELSGVVVEQDKVTNQTYMMSPIQEGFGGFIFGFDLPHSMMILALSLTIIMLGIAIYLRYRAIEEPESAPAVYDQAEELEEERSPTIENGQKKR